MFSKDKTMPWWLTVITGLAILGAGIYLLVSPESGLNALTFILAAGVLIFSLYHFYQAYKYKDENRSFVAFLVHALLDIVLFALVIVIRNSHYLLGAILASWFVIFGVFGLIHSRQDGGGKGRTRFSALFVLIGVVLLLLFFLGINHVLFLGIVAILIGVIRVVQGIVSKVRRDGRTSGGRSNLM